LRNLEIVTAGGFSPTKLQPLSLTRIGSPLLAEHKGRFVNLHSKEEQKECQATSLGSTV